MAFVKVKLDKGCSARGADMGRSDTVPEAADGSMPLKLTLVRLRWVDGDYDSGGAYWGGGEGDFIYRAHGFCNQTASEPDGDEVEIFVRAKNRKEAKTKIRKEILASVKFVKSEGRSSEFKSANEFMAAYVKCALWATNDDSNDQGGEPLGENYDGKPGEFGPGLWNKMAAECVKFEKENADDIGVHAGQAGHDFFLTRNGHGANFKDRNCYQEGAAERLYKAAKKYGEMNIYVGDDKKLYF